MKALNECSLHSWPVGHKTLPSTHRRPLGQKTLLSTFGWPTDHDMTRPLSLYISLHWLLHIPPGKRHYSTADMNGLGRGSSTASVFLDCRMAVGALMIVRWITAGVLWHEINSVMWDQCWNLSWNCKTNALNLHLHHRRTVFRIFRAKCVLQRTLWFSDTFDYQNLRCFSVIKLMKILFVYFWNNGLYQSQIW